MRLGVMWYATTVGAAGADGKHIGYLELSRRALSTKAARFRVCDAALYDVFSPDYSRTPSVEEACSRRKAFGAGRCDRTKNAAQANDRAWGWGPPRHGNGR